MKIAHVVDTMEVGGAEKLTSMLCRWQRERGHDPSVHCLYRLGPLGEQLQREGFEVVLHAASALGCGASVYRTLRHSKPDVVHCHNAAATVLSAIPARAAGARSVVVTRHGVVAPPYALRRELKFAFASRWCDWIVAVCQKALRNLSATPFAARNKLVRIYNAAIPPSVNGVPPPAKFGFTLLHVARMNAAKDQPTLLRAFALARTRVADLQLWMVGEGASRPRLEQFAQELGIDRSVTFFGQQADVGRFCAAADLFVLSSVSEGVPLSLLEALAAGLPAVVTDVGGMGEIAQLSDATTAVPASNPQAFADAIVRIVQSRDELPRLKAAAKKTFLENFTLDRMAGEYMNLYQTPHRLGTVA